MPFVLLDAFQAFAALLQLLYVPAAGMLAGGLYAWRTGWQQQAESRQRLGRMLTLFGAILAGIISVILYAMQLGAGR